MAIVFQNKKMKVKIMQPEICPQPGPQTKFFESPAEILIFGGSAGGGF